MTLLPAVPPPWSPQKRALANIAKRRRPNEDDGYFSGMAIFRQELARKTISGETQERIDVSSAELETLLEQAKPLLSGEVRGTESCSLLV